MPLSSTVRTMLCGPGSDCRVRSEIAIKVFLEVFRCVACRDEPANDAVLRAQVNARRALHVFQSDGLNHEYVALDQLVALETLGEGQQERLQGDLLGSISEQGARLFLRALKFRFGDLTAPQPFDFGVI